jgi:SEC-C motif
VPQVTIQASAAEDGPDVKAMLDVLCAAPVTLEELRRELAKRSIFTDVEQLRLTLQPRGDVEEFGDGVWAYLPQLVDDLVLTHEVTEEELELEVLDSADVELWAQLADEGLPLAGGGEVRTRWIGGPGHEVPTGSVSGLHGPPGWLADHRPGDIVGLRLRDGQLHLEPADPLGDKSLGKTQSQEFLALLAELAAAAAQEALHDHLEDGDPIPGAHLAQVVAVVRRASPDAFRVPLPPLVPLLQALGLEVWRGYVGVPGAPWHGEPPGLDDVNRSALRAWAMMLSLHRVGDALPAPEELAAVARNLVQDAALEAAGARIADEPEREPVAAAMVEAVAGATRGVPLLLRARAAEGRGDVLAAEGWLEKAASADPQLSVALADLAELRSLRGDAREAWRLYQRAGVDFDVPAFAVLRQFVRPPAGDVSRNQPCPCRSGRKYKMCHGRELRHPLPMRADWLWTKIVAFASRVRQVDVLLDYAEILAGGEAASAARRAMGDPLVVDLAIFEGGLLDVFVEECARLLPDDELALTRSWLETDRRLLEVVEANAGVSVSCRDLLTGEDIDVHDKTMSTTLEPLDLIYGRPLPDGGGVLRMLDTPRLIPRMMRIGLLGLLRSEPEGEEIAEFFAPRSRPLELRTSEGEDVVMCEARYDVADPDTVWERLAAGLEETEEWTLTELVDMPGRGSVVRGSIRRKGDRLVVEANSLERLRRLQQRLLAADPEARLIDESSVPIETLLTERQQEGEHDDRDDTGLTPEQQQEALGAVMRRHEETWPDIELPALSGRTPREAASDPELRRELEALLDDFEWTQRRQPEAPQMDIDRLRRELGMLADEGSPD